MNGGGRRASASIELLYLAAASGLTILAVSAIYRGARRRVRIEEMMVLVNALWVLLGAATVATFPGASYLFAWPALVGTICLAAVFRGRSRVGDDSRATEWLAGGVLPGAVLFTPIIVLVHNALGPRALVGATLMVALLLGLFVPVVQLTAPRRYKRAAVGVGVATALFLLVPLLR